MCNLHAPVLAENLRQLAHAVQVARRLRRTDVIGDVDAEPVGNLYTACGRVRCQRDVPAEDLESERTSRHLRLDRRRDLGVVRVLPSLEGGCRREQRRDVEARAGTPHTLDQRVELAAHVEHGRDAGLRSHAVPDRARAATKSADMHVGIHDARHHGAIREVDHALGVAQALFDRHDSAVGDAEVARPVDSARRIDQPPAAQQYVVAHPSPQLSALLLVSSRRDGRPGAEAEHE